MRGFCRMRLRGACVAHTQGSPAERCAKMGTEAEGLHPSLPRSPKPHSSNTGGAQTRGKASAASQSRQAPSAQRRVGRAGDASWLASPSPGFKHFFLPFFFSLQLDSHNWRPHFLEAQLGRCTAQHGTAAGGWPAPSHGRPPVPRGDPGHPRERAHPRPASP